jgi:hypothetical protein
MKKEDLYRIEQYHHNTNYYGTGAIDAMQEEKIDELIKRVNLLSELLASEKEQPEMTEDEMDLIQYVTNLLYYVRNEGKGMNDRFFEKWVEESINDLKAYYNREQPEETQSEYCNHVIGANDNSGICIKCGKKVCEIINNDLCKK